MIQLLYSVILTEMVLILMLLFKTPLRKLVIMALDRVKRGRGPVMVKTVSATVFVVLCSSLYSMVMIQNRSIEAGAPNPTDQVLESTHLLEASLMGFTLFLAFMIDRLHHYIRELRQLRNTMEATKKQTRGLDDSKSNPEELKALGEEVANLRSKVKKMEAECEAKTKEAKAAAEKADAVKTQSQGFIQEYERLQEDNQNLRSQIESIESEGKKDM
ncbi:Endoplasmic reticulum transmembrane protein YET-like [Linum perenne]